jgi:hypothetical protein
MNWSAESASRAYNPLPGAYQLSDFVTTFSFEEFGQWTSIYANLSIYASLSK